jgi:DNA repair exonuclease SbcCD ATPase subunit
MSLQKYRRKIDAAKAKLNHAKERVKDERTALIKAEDMVTRVGEAQTIVQHVAQGVQQQAHDRIASVVSRCLKTVFAEEAYKFKIHFERKRGRTEARLAFVKGPHELDPRSGSGGGVIDVAAFALRLACLLLTKPSPRRILVMDEPFKNVHGSIYRERVGLMLESLAEEMDFQFIMSTGIEDFHIGKVINLENL